MTKNLLRAFAFSVILALASLAGMAQSTTVRAPGSGGGTSGSVTINDPNTTSQKATVNASGQLSVTCANCSGSGVSVLEDAASANGDAGTPAYAVRKATPANTSGTDGDYEALQISAGRLWTSAVIDTALPAGTNAIGKLAANSGVDIGDVDVTSVPADPFGVNADAASATGSISAKLRFIASTGIPITGTVTVGSHAVTNAGTFVVQENGAALTSLQLIDNAVQTVAAGTVGTNSFLTGGIYNSTPITLTNGQGSATQFDANGYLKVNVAAGGASGGTSSSFGSAVPATGTAVGYSDGTNMQLARVSDGDSGAGTEYIQNVSLRIAASGGSIPLTAGAGAVAAGTIRMTLASDDPLNAKVGAAGALADNTANPTVGAIATYNMCYDGSTWDRCQSSTITEVTEDAAETAGAVGTYAMTVRRDSAASSAGTDGDNATLNTDSLGRLWVNCGTGCSGGTQYTHDAALTIGSSSTTLSGARASAAVPTDVSADNDAVALWALRSGALAIQQTYGGVLASAGNGASGTGVQRVTIANDSTGILAAVTSITNTVTVGGVAAHDAVASGSPVLGGAYASAAAPADVSADGDAVRIWALRNGSQVVNLAAGGTLMTATSTSLNVNCTGGCSGGTQYTHDAALTIGSSSTTLAGARASAAAPTDVSADNDAVALWALRSGALAVQPTFGGTLAAAGNGTAATAQRVTIASDSTGLITVNPGTAANWGVYVEDAAETAGGNLMMAGAVRRDTLASSSGSSGDNSTLNTAADGALYTANVGATNGGGTGSFITSAASTNSTSVKASAGQIYSIFAINTTATVYYLRLYNSSSAPTCSSATGFVGSIPIPASTTGAGVSIPIPIGWAFGTGIGYCLTGGSGSTDNTNAATGIFGAIVYK